MPSEGIGLAGWPGSTFIRTLTQPYLVYHSIWIRFVHELVPIAISNGRSDEMGKIEFDRRPMLFTIRRQVWKTLSVKTICGNESRALSENSNYSKNLPDFTLELGREERGWAIDRLYRFELSENPIPRFQRLKPRYLALEGKNPQVLGLKILYPLLLFVTLEKWFQYWCILIRRKVISTPLTGELTIEWNLLFQSFPIAIGEKLRTTIGKIYFSNVYRKWIHYCHPWRCPSLKSLWKF